MVSEYAGMMTLGGLRDFIEERGIPDNATFDDDFIRWEVEGPEPKPFDWVGARAYGDLVRAAYDTLVQATLENSATLGKIIQRKPHPNGLGSVQKFDWYQEPES